MFRAMRRSRQLLSQEKATEILQRNTSGTLAVLGDDDYPYAVPLSYVFADGKLYMHSAKTGHKVDAVRKHEKASFCVIDQDQIVPKEYTTYFRSVIAFGKVRLLEDEQQMRRAAETLAMKYAPEFSAGIPASIDAAIGRMAILEMTIDHMTAKEAIELVGENKEEA